MSKKCAIFSIVLIMTKHVMKSYYIQARLRIIKLIFKLYLKLLKLSTWREREREMGKVST